MGVYLHEGPSQGEIIHWYNFIIAMNGDANISFAGFIQNWLSINCHNSGKQISYLKNKTI